MSIDFYVAVITFIIIVVYFLFQISSIVPNFINQIEEQRLMSEAYQVSEILVNDIGQPKNWDTLIGNVGQISRIGLSDQNTNKTNLIATNKVDALRYMCLGQKGYMDVKHRLGMNELNFSVFVVNRQTGSIDTCAGEDADETTGLPRIKGFTATVTRILAFNDGTYGDLKVQVWES